MQVYLVGGAVRDELLGLPVTERDWVVVGASPEQMESQGYKPVGKDFPVFLHPHSKEEYALARTERKKGRGYHGFEIHASPEVSLEEDLRRRDLTINAIAKSDSNDIIDPYDGQSDLQNKVLRHVSDAFAEDPLRVLRVARFVAKFHSLGFSIAKETQQLMRHIVTTREILELSPERIWQETRKALCTPSPEQFFIALHSCGALTQTHPSISDEFANYEAQQLGLTALNKTSQNEDDACIRLATFLAGLFYYNHENSFDSVQALCEKLILPKACKELLLLTASKLKKCQHVFELNEVDLLSLLRSMDMKRKPQRFEALLRIFSAVHASANDGDTYLQAGFLLQASQIIEDIDIEAWIREKISPEELANNIKNTQHELLKNFIQDRNSWVEKNK